MIGVDFDFFGYGFGFAIYLSRTVFSENSGICGSVGDYDFADFFSFCVVCDDGFVFGG
jgi:hypothetical protein